MIILLGNCCNSVSNLARLDILKLIIPTDQRSSEFPGIFLSITTFVGLIVRYIVHEFDPNAGLVSVTTSRVGNRDFASLSVSRNFLERILEFIEESISIVATIIPIGFSLCTIFNRHFAKIRAGHTRMTIQDDRVLSMTPKYVIIGDSQACQMPNSTRLRPLVRDTIYQLIRTHLKPKLIVEDSFEAAKKLGIRIGLLRRDHHKLAVIKSVDLLKNITDSRGDIKQAKVRYLLSRLKVLSQSTPADKSFLVYLIKHCETLPNEGLAYLGYSFTDPEAMKLADCSITFNDCDDDDVKNAAQVRLKSDNLTFTDVYLFISVTLLHSNIIQSYALYQISAAVSSCLYRFLSITVFQEQLMSHSQFMLLTLINQLFAIAALMTKWISSLPKMSMRSSSVAEMSHAVTEDSMLASNLEKHHSRRSGRAKSRSSLSLPQGVDHSDSTIFMQNLRSQSGSSRRHRSSTRTLDLEYESNDENDLDSITQSEYEKDDDEEEFNEDDDTSIHRKRKLRSRGSRHSERHYKPIHLSGIDLDHAIIDSKQVNTYKQTFHNSMLIDDVTYRLAKLHIAYQILVMIIIMIFGKSQKPFIESSVTRIK